MRRGAQHSQTRVEQSGWLAVLISGAVVQWQAVGMEAMSERAESTEQP